MSWRNQTSRAINKALESATRNVTSLAHYGRLVGQIASPSHNYWENFYRDHLDGHQAKTPLGNNQVQARMPRKHIWKYYDQVGKMREDEKREFMALPTVGVDHLYHAHLGSLSKPLNISHPERPSYDVVVSCDGECNIQVPDSISYNRVPNRTLVLCGDCGFHWTMRSFMTTTLDPDEGDLPNPGDLKAEDVESVVNDVDLFGSYLRM